MKGQNERALSVGSRTLEMRPRPAPGRRPQDGQMSRSAPLLRPFFACISSVTSQLVRAGWGGSAGRMAAARHRGRIEGRGAVSADAPRSGTPITVVKCTGALRAAGAAPHLSLRRWERWGWRGWRDAVHSIESTGRSRAFHCVNTSSSVGGSGAAGGAGRRGSARCGRAGVEQGRAGGRAARGAG